MSVVDPTGWMSRRDTGVIDRARQLCAGPHGCAVGSWSGQRPRLVPYVTGAGLPTPSPGGIHVTYLLVNIAVPERVAMMTVTGHKIRSAFGRYHIVSRRICERPLGSVTSPLRAGRGSPIARTTLQTCLGSAIMATKRTEMPQGHDGER